MCTAPVAPAEMEAHLQLCLEDTIVLSGEEQETAPVVLSVADEKEEVGIVLSGAPADEEDEAGIVLSGAPADEEEEEEGEEGAGLFGEPSPEAEGRSGSLPADAGVSTAAASTAVTAALAAATVVGGVEVGAARATSPAAAAVADATGATTGAVVSAADDSAAGAVATAAASGDCWEVPSRTQSEDGIQLLSDHDSEYGEEGGTAASDEEGRGGAVPLAAAPVLPSLSDPPRRRPPTPPPMPLPLPPSPAPSVGHAPSPPLPSGAAAPMDVAGRGNGDAEGPRVHARGGWDATAAATANRSTAGWGGGVWRGAGVATPPPRRHPPPLSLPAPLAGRAASALLLPRPAAAPLLLPVDWAVAPPGRLPPVPPPPRPAAAVDNDGGGAGGAADGGRLPPAAGVTMADLAAALGVAAVCLRATRSRGAM